MGYYINPKDMSKKQWLVENGAEISKPAASRHDVAGDELVVCLVDNGAFTPAGIAYDDNERDAFMYPDPRPMRLIGTLPSPVQSKLMALDYFRMGYLYQGMCKWFYERWGDGDFERPPKFEDDHSIPDYDRDKKGFKAGVRNVAARLKAAGY